MFYQHFLQSFSLFLGFSCLFIAETCCQEMMKMDTSESMHHSMIVPGSSGMPGLYGVYTMTREASGTSWQPEATPMQGIHFMSDKNPYDYTMIHGFANLVDDHQGGPRGENKRFSSSMFMWMGRKSIGENIIGFRAMLSGDPVMGKKGYPLLFQVGETADGRTELLDWQHPHDAFMELALTYAKIFSDQQSAFVYMALPGEPAVGPPAFMHRYSGEDIPEAPLTHHKIDATHVSFGVLTLGYIYQNLKFEGSLFNGREPDQFRWNIEAPKLNSAAVRISYNPTPTLALQLSTAHLKSPESLKPSVNINRTTASLMYDYVLNSGYHWQSTLVWGKNNYHPGNGLYGYLLESTMHLNNNHSLFGRVERLQINDLFTEDNPLHDNIFTVNKLSMGYLYEMAHFFDNSKWGVGGLVSAYKYPAELKPFYGNKPLSYMLFIRIRL
jgi:hypothetical protein